MNTVFARTSQRRNRLIAAAGVAAVAIALSACSTGASPATTSSADTPVKVVLGWYADPESGGMYAAEAEGYFKDSNLKVSIQQGGPTVSGTQIVAGGRADIGISDATSIALAQQQGIPIVAIAAVYQTNPLGVMVHADSGVSSFADMSGHTFVVQTGQAGTAYLEKTKGLKFTTQTYSGSIANFIANKDLVQQGWPTNEVYQAKQKGVNTKFFSYASAGFNPYNDVVFATKAFVKKNPNVVKKFLAASMKGWSAYMGDVKVATTTNDVLKKVNTEQTSQSIWFAWDAQRKYVTAGDGAAQLGVMTMKRWTTVVSQLTDLGILTKKVAPADLFDSTMLPKVAAPASLPAAPAGSF
ncbi:ABC transporter substrate-binding protein [Glaciihabitans sp. UYNi722]|uniref:ABC transporter substrate-binding protein n=1 Tax=Glaciihabitans sp. UYNi722 TaxID=3156344 RepID=UPI003397C18C